MATMKVSVIITAVCLVLAVSGSVVVCLCTFWPYWKITKVENQRATPVFINEGIWKRCMTFNHDNQTDHVCYEFDTSLLQLPPGLEQARRYSIISVASGFTFVATAASSLVFGVVCSRNGRCCFKIIMFMSLMASSASALLSAGSILRAVIEYDQEIQKSRQTPSSNVPLHMMLLQKRGNCIYYGWIGGGLLICGATMSLITAIAGIVVLYRKKNSSFTEVLDDRLQLVTSCET